MNRDTGRVDLNKGRIGKVGALAVSGDCCGAVAPHGVRRKEVSVAITTRSQNNGVGCETLKLAGNQIFSNDTTGSAVDDNDVLHLVAAEQLDGSGVDLTHQCGVRTEQELLAGLAFRIERTAYQSSTERTVGQ